MKKRSELRLFVLVFAATSLALFCLLEFRVIERVSYAMERGRLQALRETLPSADRLSELAEAGRTVAKLVAPAVVSIETEQREWLVDAAGTGTPESNRSRTEGTDDERDAEEDASDWSLDVADDWRGSLRHGLGSGFVIDAENGHILTNAHVVAGADQIRVYLADGRESDATVLGIDPETDLAVIQIDHRGLHELPLAADGQAQVGDDVFAIGNPFGLEGSVTKGIVSAVQRRNVRVSGNQYRTLLQTDAVITPGSSGGPLVNMRGEVIGVNTAMATNSGRYDGVGFAVPVAKIRAVLADLIDGGPGSLGVMVGSARYWQQECNNLGWTKPFGALVTDVVPGRAADRGGIFPDDIVLSIDGTRVGGHEDLARSVAGTAPGVKVRLDVWRNRREKTIVLRIGRKYAPAG